MSAHPDDNGPPKKPPKNIHAIVEAKGFILRAYEKRLRKLDRYLKTGVIDEERYTALRNEFADNADALLRTEVKDQKDYSFIRLMAVFDIAEAIEFKLK
jgi:hypothetical protein